MKYQEITPPNGIKLDLKAPTSRLLSIILLLTVNSFALDCKESCNLYGGMSVAVVGIVAMKYNPYLGQFIVVGGQVPVAYTCDYVCEIFADDSIDDYSYNDCDSEGLSICVDNEKYAGGATAVDMDECECIEDYDGQIFIDEDCNGHYSRENLDDIIDSDPGEAFYECN